MGPIETSLIISFFLIFFGLYIVKTRQAALARREEMLKYVKEILRDKKTSQRLKQAGVVAVHASAISTAFPRFVFRKIRRGEAVNLEHLFENNELKKIKRLNEHFLEVNVRLAPHYYLLAICAVLFIVAKALLQRKLISILGAIHKFFQDSYIYVYGKR